MKRFISIAGAGWIILSFKTMILACPQCRAQVLSSVYNDSFFLNLFLLLTPIVIICLLGVTGYFLEEIMTGLKQRFRK